MKPPNLGLDHSAIDGRARFTLHTSFEDPTAAVDAEARESLETRCFAFFGAGRLRHPGDTAPGVRHHDVVIEPGGRMRAQTGDMKALLRKVTERVLSDASRRSEGVPGWGRRCYRGWGGMNGAGAQSIDERGVGVVVSWPATAMRMARLFGYLSSDPTMATTSTSMCISGIPSAFTPSAVHTGRWPPARLRS